MLRILTDAGSDITYNSAASHGVESLEIDINFEEFSYDLRADEDFSTFYDLLKKAKNLPTTSQITPASYLDVFNNVKERGEEMLVITLSSGISGTYSSAVTAKQECDYDGITVVDSKQAIIPQGALVKHAVMLRNEGKNRAEIETALLNLRERLQMFAALDTLTYLKKGGRVPPAMALIGNALRVKPVITMEGGKLEAVDKVRGTQAAKRVLWDYLEKIPRDDSWPVYFGHTNNEARCIEFVEETCEKFNLKKEQ